MSVSGAMNVTDEAETHAEPLQYHIPVVEDASRLVRFTSAVPAENPRIERS